MKKELLIHFTDVSICLNNLKELGIAITPELKKFIIGMHDCVRTVTYEIPIKVMAEVCFRSANKIIYRIEQETNIKFIRYKLHNYQL